MKPISSFPLCFFLCLLSVSAQADDVATEVPTAASQAMEPTPPIHNTWTDRQHRNIQATINRWAHNMDDWFGTPDPDKPASANLRIMMDTTWNKYDRFSVRPRIRGKLKLPVLQQRLNVVFGDDSIDRELEHTGHIYDESQLNNERTFDRTRSRESNSSLALRWSDINRYTGIDTDTDIGIRSGDDLYLRFRGTKDWDLNDGFSTRLEQTYRYGIKSRHHARTNWEVRQTETGETFNANNLNIEYNHKKDDEKWLWGNSLYRQHDFAGHKRLNYGIYAGGRIKNKKLKLNSYGPFAGWRQPVWRDWLFVQTELNYLNNREENRRHHIGTLVRVEALF